MPGKSMFVPVKKDPKELSLEEKVALLREIEDAAKVKGVSSTQAVYMESDLLYIIRTPRGWIWSRG